MVSTETPDMQKESSMELAIGVIHKISVQLRTLFSQNLSSDSNIVNKCMIIT